MARKYRVMLTGPQLRLVHESLSLILNDPDWPVSEQDFQTIGRADETIQDAWREAMRAESMPTT